MALSSNNNRGCKDGVELLSSTIHRGTYNEAQRSCSALGGRLAIPTTKKKLDRLNGQIEKDTFVGLRLSNHGNKFRNYGRNRLPNYKAVKEYVKQIFAENAFTNGDKGQFPWIEANNEGTALDQKCVILLKNTSTLRSAHCNNKYGVTCERLCRTSFNFVEEGNCENSKMLYAIKEKATFDGALNACESIHSQGQLAVATDVNYFARMNQLLQGLETAFVGISDFLDKGGSNSSRFVTLDGTHSSFTSVPVGTFPWDLNQPNDFDNNQNCVITRKKNGNQFLLGDVSCDERHFSICERPCTPASQSVPPSNTPTSAISVPTESGTILSGDVPTLVPTQVANFQFSIVNELARLAIGIVVVISLAIVLVLAGKKRRHSGSTDPEDKKIDDESQATLSDFAVLQPSNNLSDLESFPTNIEIASNVNATTVDAFEARTKQPTDSPQHNLNLDFKGLDAENKAKNSAAPLSVREDFHHKDASEHFNEVIGIERMDSDIERLDAIVKAHTDVVTKIDDADIEQLDAIVSSHANTNINRDYSQRDTTSLGQINDDDPDIALLDSFLTSKKNVSFGDVDSDLDHGDEDLSDREEGVLDLKSTRSDPDIEALDDIIRRHTPGYVHNTRFKEKVYKVKRSTSSQSDSLPLITSLKKSKSLKDHGVHSVQMGQGSKEATRGNAFDSDIARLDQIIATNTQADSTSELKAVNRKGTELIDSRPDSIYIANAASKAPARRSIFAPSNEYIQKAVLAKKRNVDLQTIERDI